SNSGSGDVLILATTGRGYIGVRKTCSFSMKALLPECKHWMAPIPRLYQYGTNDGANLLKLVCSGHGILIRSVSVFHEVRQACPLRPYLRVCSSNLAAGFCDFRARVHQYHGAIRFARMADGRGVAPKRGASPGADRRRLPLGGDLARTGAL